VYGEHVPIDLRGRAASILWNSGKRHEAIEAMQKIVEEAPQHYAACTALTEWMREGGDASQYLAARPAHRRDGALTIPRPRDSLARRACGRTIAKRAKAASPSRQIAPDYLYGGFQLFELQLADKEYARRRPDAGDDAPAHGSRPRSSCARSASLRRSRISKRPSAKLGELCVLPSRDGAQLRDAVDVLRKQAWMPVVEKAFGRRHRDAAGARVGGWVVGRSTSPVPGDFKQAMKLVEQLMGRGEVGLRAASVFLQDAAEKQQKRFVHKVIRRHQRRAAARSGGVARGRLRADDAGSAR
jgi:hypothetical protein